MQKSYGTPGIIRYKASELEEQNIILQGINQILREAITCETEEELGRTCLEVALNLTRSKFGFIGLINSEGCMDNIAISDLGWDLCRMPGFSNLHKLPKNLNLNGLYGRVLKDGKSIFTNDPMSHPDSMGPRDGHVRLDSFLGTPLVQNGQTIGIIGMGNKVNGYSYHEVNTLETLVQAIVQVLTHKRADSALQESEDKYRSLFNSIDQGFCIIEMQVDSEGNPIDWLFVETNQVFKQSFIKDAEGKVIRDLMPVYEEHWFETFGKVALTGEAIRFISESKALNRWYDVFAFKTDDSASKKVAVLINDITEGKKAEELLKSYQMELEKLVHERTRELRESNQILIQTLESITDVFFTLDQDWRVTYWNKAAEDTFNFTRRDILGKNLWEVFPGLIASEVYNQCHHSIRENLPVSFVWQCNHNKSRWLEARTYPSNDGLAIYLNDITAHKKAIEDLILSQDQFYKVFNLSPLPMAIASKKQDNFIEVNEGFLSMAGLTKAEVKKSAHRIVMFGWMVMN